MVLRFEANVSGVPAGGGGTPPPAMPAETSASTEITDIGLSDLTAAAASVWPGAEKPADLPADAAKPDVPAQVATPDAPEKVEAVADKPAEIAPEKPAEPVATEPFAALKGEVATLKTSLTAKEQELATLQGQVTQYEAYKPIAEALAAPGSLDIVKIIQPLLTAELQGWDDPRAAEIGQQIVAQLKEFDQGVGGALAKGLQLEYNDWFYQQALLRNGIDANKLRDFKAWEAGAVDKPIYSLGEFPAADAEGHVRFPMPNGKWKEFDLRDVDGTPNEDNQDVYDMAKSHFDRTLEDRNRQAQEAKATTQREQEAATAARDKLAVEATTRRSTWEQERRDYQAQVYNKANPAFPEEFEWAHKAASGLAHVLMNEDSAYHKNIIQGREAAFKGEGRRAAFGQDAANIEAKQIAFAVSKMSELVNEVLSLRQQVQTGQPGKPRLPADAPKVTTETPRLTTQTAIPDQPVNGQAKEPEFQGDAVEWAKSMVDTDPALAQVFKQFGG
jgi:hypothetical protein